MKKLIIILSLSLIVILGGCFGSDTKSNNPANHSGGKAPTQPSGIDVLPVQPASRGMLPILPSTYPNEKNLLADADFNAFPKAWKKSGKAKDFSIVPNGDYYKYYNALHIEGPAETEKVTDNNVSQEISIPNVKTGDIYYVFAYLRNPKYKNIVNPKYKTVEKQYIPANVTLIGNVLDGHPEKTYGSLNYTNYTNTPNWQLAAFEFRIGHMNISPSTAKIKVVLNIGKGGGADFAHLKLVKGAIDPKRIPVLPKDIKARWPQHNIFKDGDNLLYPIQRCSGWIHEDKEATKRIGHTTMVDFTPGFDQGANIKLGTDKNIGSTSKEKVNPLIIMSPTKGIDANFDIFPNIFLPKDKIYELSFDASGYENSNLTITARYSNYYSGKIIKDENHNKDIPINIIGASKNISHQVVGEDKWGNKKYKDLTFPIDNINILAFSPKGDHYKIYFKGPKNSFMPMMKFDCYKGTGVVNIQNIKLIPITAIGGTSDKSTYDTINLSNEANDPNNWANGKSSNYNPSWDFITNSYSGGAKGLKQDFAIKTQSNDIADCQYSKNYIRQDGNQGVKLYANYQFNDNPGKPGQKVLNGKEGQLISRFAVHGDYTVHTKVKFDQPIKDIPGVFAIWLFGYNEPSSNSVESHMAPASVETNEIDWEMLARVYKGTPLFTPYRKGKIVLNADTMNKAISSPQEKYITSRCNAYGGIYGGNDHIQDNVDFIAILKANRVDLNNISNIYDFIIEVKQDNGGTPGYIKWSCSVNGQKPILIHQMNGNLVTGDQIPHGKMQLVAGFENPQWGPFEEIGNTKDHPCVYAQYSFPDRTTSGPLKASVHITGVSVTNYNPNTSIPSELDYNNELPGEHGTSNIPLDYVN